MWSRAVRYLRDIKVFDITVLINKYATVEREDCFIRNNEYSKNNDKGERELIRGNRHCGVAKCK